MYSQGAEEAAILESVADIEHGRFLDIGAYDGKKFSNTFALVERGWFGVMVEPSPSAFVGLLHNMAEFPRVELVNALVDSADGLREFHDGSGDGTSTTEPGNRAKWAAAGTKFRAITVVAVTVATLLDEFPYNYDFISIDTEGTSGRLFCELVGRCLRTRTICVEHDGAHAQLAAWAVPHGFRQIYLDGNNLIVSRNP